MIKEVTLALVIGSAFTATAFYFLYKQPTVHPSVRIVEPTPQDVRELDQLVTYEQWFKQLTDVDKKRIKFNADLLNTPYDVILQRTYQHDILPDSVKLQQRVDKLEIDKEVERIRKESGH